MSLSDLFDRARQADATRVVFNIQRQAGIDLPTDGELYRFDVNHPDTNGMIEYFIRPMAGISSVVGRSITEEFARHSPMGFRRKPAGVVTGPLADRIDAVGSLRALESVIVRPEVSGKLVRIHTWYAEQLAYLLGRLAAIPDSPTARLYPWPAKTCQARYVLAK